METIQRTRIEPLVRMSRGDDPRPQINPVSSAAMPQLVAVMGHERRFRDVGRESGLHPAPEGLRQRNEPTLRAIADQIDVKIGWAKSAGEGLL